MDKVKFFKEKFFLFKGLSDSEINTCLSFDGISELNYNSGDIIQDSTVCDKIGIIIKGKAVVKSGENGIIINNFKAGDIYGVAALFASPTYSTVILASTDCTVFTMNRSFVEKCIANSKICSINYIDVLAKKVSFLNQKINAFTAKSAENKLYAYLLQQPHENGVLYLSVDMSTVAKMLGIGRATLYRAFDKLILNGTITKVDKKIIFNEVLK